MLRISIIIGFVCVFGVRAHADVLYESYIGIQSNFPTAGSSRLFSAGVPSLKVGYRYQLNKTFVTGLQISQRNLWDIKHQELLNSWDFGFETLLVYRVSRASFLHYGFKWGIFRPMKDFNASLHASDYYMREVSLGLVLEFLYEVSDSIRIMGQLERWRGIRTDTFHTIGYSLAVGFRH